MSGLFPEPSAPAAEPAPLYRVLARKWRPLTFDGLIGQDVLVQTLRHAFATGRVAHAFMLTGVRGVGKTSAARIIARALNCTGPDGTSGPTITPCGVCPNCTAILADRHPDVTELDAASNNSVDDVRAIIDAVRFRPMLGRMRVFILDEVHMLSKPAFNALLKTLEEPPPDVTFIFATTEVRRVPITVLSRCQRFDLRRLSASELSAHFSVIAAREGVTVAPEALAMIARAADGSVRDGLSLLDQAIAQAGDGAPVTAEVVAAMLGLANRSALFDLLEAVLVGEVAAALAITDRLHSLGADPGEILTDLLELVHTLTRLKLVPGLPHTSELPELERERGAALAARVSLVTLGRCWQMLLKGLGELETAPEARAAAEMLLIRLCHVAELPPPGELVRQLSEATPAPPASAPLPVPPMAGGGGTPHAGALAVAATAPVAVRARPASFAAVVALIAGQRDPVLHAHLLHSVHLVRFAPPVIELRPEASAPPDLAARLAARLGEITGERWVVALVGEGGEPTLAEQETLRQGARLSAAARHPLVQAILAAFPGAHLEAVRDLRGGRGEEEPQARPLLGDEAEADSEGDAEFESESAEAASAPEAPSDQEG
jgi:DNA polymerase-3 subunit gamma/tau